ncbi:TIGR02808 family protein [Sansalvadorimonas sp. 2012CJ34-2]|uniref:TIGR02808 family protein n=1 Tax=Parendozoicomonas callyspongiae TaxID=2942213 RepID=A0ABT0PC12_9GAMM|nr:TIGR02808 family protein [Sansalvadorimonas sp. 2012CJ34-2]MCL6268920.1 TIGR02808 family protein [Sansalvadorimonas sp. 2012CJ34-2]
MGSLETVIWYILGYSALPMILLGGFIGTAVVACFLLELTGRK